MKKILLWDPRTPASDPLRLTVADEIASAAVRAGVAAAVDPAEHAGLVAGGPLDAGDLKEVVIQHGPRNSMLRVMLPASVAAVGAQLGLVAAVRRALAAGSAPAPLPTLIISGPLTYSADAAAGTVVATVGNVPAGATLSVSPNDGRIAVNGNQVVVGLSASSAGSYQLTVSAPGANSASATVDVTAVVVTPPDGATGVLRFASPRNRVPNAVAEPGNAVTVDYEVLIWAEHMIGSGDLSELRARLDNFYIEQGTTKGVGNSLIIKALYLESMTDASTVPVVFANRPYPFSLSDGEADVVSEPITPQMFAPGKTVFKRGEKYRYRGVISMPGGVGKYPAHWIPGDAFVGGFAYYPTVRTPNNLDKAGEITWDGATSGGSVTMNGYSHFIPMLLGKFVSGDPLVYLGMGDSIFMGSGDGGDGNGTGAGIFSRFLFTPTPELTGRAGCNAAVNGGAAGTWTSGGNGGLNPRLATLVKYANRTVDNYGTNNFPTAPNYSGSAQASTQGQVYSPWPHLRSLASSAPGTKPMKIWRTKLMPRTAGGITTPFPEDQAFWKGGAEVSEQWEATGIPGELSSTDKFHDWLQTQLANGAVDGIIDFDPLVRADPYGDRSTSVLYHRWAGGSFILSDGTHPSSPGARMIAAYLDDRVTALEGGVIRPKFNLIGSSRKLEGASGQTTTYQFMVTRNTTGGAASVDWAVEPFSGTTIKPTDFAAGVIPSGTVTIPDGAAHATFDVVVKGDNDSEGNELFNVVLSNPSNGYGIYFATARGQITNDDGDPPLWTPDQLGAKLVDYFLPASLAGQTTVATWTGATGVLSYAQGDTTKQPTFASGSYGNKGGVTFDGTDDYLDMGGVAALPSGASHFGMFASEFENNTPRMILFSHGGGAPTNTRVLGKNSGSGEPYVDQGAFAKLGTATWNNKLIAFVLECSAQPSSLATLWQNGLAPDTATLPSNPIAAGGTARLGAAIPGISAWAPWKGSVGHHGFLSAPLTEAERQRLEGWMSWNNGQNGGNLPSSHPFKTVAPVIEAA